MRYELWYFATMKPIVSERIQNEYRIALELMRTQLIVSRYSTSTIHTYSYMFREFLKAVYPLPLYQVNKLHLQMYHRDLIYRKKVSRSYQNQSINAIKFYLERVLKQDRAFIDLERPKRPQVLPQVLSLNEIKRILGCTSNLKHKTILTTLYSGGLRMGELLNLKLADIDSEGMRIWIREGKGVKDRLTVLSPKLLELLRSYYKEYRPKNYLFEGPNGGPYSASSVRKVLQRAVNKAGIKKHIRPHTLRHSFATHLLEHGTNLRYIQTLLGHNNAKTTEIYTHVTTQKLSEVKSPLDLMG